MFATITVSVRTPSRPAPPSPPSSRMLTSWSSPKGSAAFVGSVTVALSPSSKTESTRPTCASAIRTAATAGATTPAHEQQHHQTADGVLPAARPVRQRRPVAGDHQDQPEHGQRDDPADDPPQRAGVDGQVDGVAPAVGDQPDGCPGQQQEEDQDGRTQPAAAGGQEGRARDQGARHGEQQGGAEAARRVLAATGRRGPTTCEPVRSTAGRDDPTGTVASSLTQPPLARRSGSSGHVLTEKAAGLGLGDGATYAGDLL